MGEHDSGSRPGPFLRDGYYICIPRKRSPAKLMWVGFGMVHEVRRRPSRWHLPAWGLLLLPIPTLECHAMRHGLTPKLWPHATVTFWLCSGVTCKWSVVRPSSVGRGRPVKSASPNANPQCICTPRKLPGGTENISTCPPTPTQNQAPRKLCGGRKGIAKTTFQSLTGPSHRYCRPGRMGPQADSSANHSWADRYCRWVAECVGHCLVRVVRGAQLGQHGGAARGSRLGTLGVSMSRRRRCAG